MLRRPSGIVDGYQFFETIRGPYRRWVTNERAKRNRAAQWQLHAIDQPSAASACIDQRVIKAELSPTFLRKSIHPGPAASIPWNFQPSGDLGTTCLWIDLLLPRGVESLLRPTSASIMEIDGATNAADIEAGSKHPVNILGGLAGEGAAAIHKVRVNRI